jgi:hypothetical protein
MLTVPDTDLPVGTLARHAVELHEAQELLKKAEAIIERQLSESQGRPALHQAAVGVSEAISRIGGVKMHLSTLVLMHKVGE